MDDSSISLEFSESIDIDQELGYEVPDLHRDLVVAVPFEVDSRFEFNAPQYYEFLEEMQQNFDTKESAEDPSHDEWFCEHHIEHEAQKSLVEVAAPARRRFRIVSRPEESGASIEKLLAEHNRKIREDHMVKVKCKKAGLESAAKSPTKGSNMLRREPSNQILSPQRKCSSRKSNAFPSCSSASSDSPRKSGLARKSVIISSAALESPRRSRVLNKSSNSHLRSACSRQPLEITSSAPELPPRKPLLRKSMIVAEPKEIKLKTRDNNAVSSSQHNVTKSYTQSTLAKKRTRVEVSICAPDAKSSKTSAGKGIPIVKRPRSGKENVDDIAEMLSVHNKKFKTKAAYVPRQHSTRDVRLWEKMTGKLWYELSPEERQIANQEIGEMKNEQTSNIKQTVQDGLGYLRCPR